MVNLSYFSALKLKYCFIDGEATKPTGLTKGQKKGMV